MAGLFSTGLQLSRENGIKDTGVDLLFFIARDSLEEEDPD